MTETKKKLWVILVPTVNNDGKPFRTRFHRVWDAKVREISGGLTIMPVSKGQWVHEDQIFKERMIPVQILATEAEISDIVDMSIKYYDQIAVMAYEISKNVILRYRDEVKPTAKLPKPPKPKRVRPTSGSPELNKALNTLLKSDDQTAGWIRAIKGEE